MHVTEVKENNFDFTFSAFFENNSVKFFMITPSLPEEGWDKWNETTESKKLEALDRILGQSNISNGEVFDWGHVKANFDGKSAISSLVVAYYKPINS